MFDPPSVMVRVTVAVDMSMSVTVAEPAEGTNRWPLTSIGAPGLEPTEIDDPIIAPVDALKRSTFELP